MNVGDKINLYAAYSTAVPIKGATLPRAQLLLSGVRVLDVNQVIAANTTTAADGTVRAGGASVTYLLAVKTTDVEKLVFASKFESLVATLTDGQSPQSTRTPGAGGDNILDVQPRRQPDRRVRAGHDDHARRSSSSTAATCWPTSSGPRSPTSTPSPRWSPAPASAPSARSSRPTARSTCSSPVPASAPALAWPGSA